MKVSAIFRSALVSREPSKTFKILTSVMLFVIKTQVYVFEYNTSSLLQEDFLAYLDNRFLTITLVMS